MMDRKTPTFIALYFVIRHFSVVFINIDVISTKTKFQHNVKKLVRNRIYISENYFKLIIHTPVFSFENILSCFKFIST